MNIVAKLQLSNGSYSINENDIIAGFVGDECRGVISPNASLGGLLFLTIGSNQTQGETVTFKAYISVENLIVDIEQTVVFQNQQLIGTPAEPLIFTYQEGPPTYTLSLAANPADGGTVIGEGQYEENSVVLLSANPNNGFEFNNWINEANNVISDQSSFEFVMPGEDVAITANFGVLTYTLTYLSGQNGSISGETIQVVNHGNSGSPVEAIPSEGYYFVQWSDGITENPRTDLNVTQDITVTAMFEIEIPLFTLTISVQGEGTTSPIPGAYEYPAGSMVNLFASPSPGYEFQKWIVGNNEFTTQSIQITINENINVTAWFQETTVTQYTLDVGVNGYGTTIPPPGNYYYNENSQIQLNAIPDNSWEFEKWLINGMEMAENPAYVTITENITAIAHFTEIPTNLYTLTITITGEGSVEVNGTVYSQAITVDEGTMLNLEAMAATGWQFEGWGGDLISANVNESINMDADKTITATFGEMQTQQFTLTVSLAGQGSVEVNGATYSEPISVDEGSTLNLEAIPADEWQFEGWTGDLTSNNLVENITIDGDKTITATFFNPTNIFESLIQKIAYYPNPAQTELWVEFSNLGSRNINIQLTNLQGQIVDQKSIDDQGKVQTSFNVSRLHPGVYLLLIKGDKWNVARKVVVKP